MLQRAAQLALNSGVRANVLAVAVEARQRADVDVLSMCEMHLQQG